jgi:hypothetical protein
MANSRRGRGRKNNNRARNRNAGTHAQRQNALPNHVMLKPSYTAPYKFSRSFSIGNLPRGNTDLGHAFPFALSQLPNSSEFTSLFDKYRIRQVDIRMVLVRVNPTDSVPTIWAYMDDDDATIPITFDAVKERQSVRPFTFSSAKHVYSASIQPRWLIDSINKKSLAPRDMWIDMANPSVEHYGLKLWCQDYSNSTGSVISVDATIHFECQSVR